MSTPSFGQPPAFGAPVSGPVQTPVEPEPEGRGRRTVVIAVAAGVVALGVLGGAAALVLTGGEDTVEAIVPRGTPAAVEPSVPASTASAPLPTAAVLGRNVFVPLVDQDAEAAGGGAVEAPAAPVAGPTASPTASPTSLPVSTFVPPVSLPAAPAPTVTEVVEVPVPGPTTVITAAPTPGPTTTQTVSPYRYEVTAVSVESPEDPDSPVTFSVNGAESAGLLPGDYFGDDYFRYVENVPGEGVTFFFGSSLWTLAEGKTLGLGAP